MPPCEGIGTVRFHSKACFPTDLWSRAHRGSGKRIRTVAQFGLLVFARAYSRIVDSTNSQLRVSALAHSRGSNLGRGVVDIRSSMTFERKVALYAVGVMLSLYAAAWVSASARHYVRVAYDPVPARALIIPVDGVQPDQLVDSWGTLRGSGRAHEGIDIMARAGTPVRATMAGTIAKLFRSSRGGITIYEFDPTGRYVFYYAHLKAYAAGLHEGQAVVQGQQIGFVGSTGNATTPHLHFEIQFANAERQWWRGSSFDPYPALKSGTLEGRLARW